MDRRNFFKRWSAVAVVPFVPFKWERPKEETYINIKGPVYGYDDIKKARRSIKEKKVANGTYTHSITIDGRNCSDVCTSIEIHQEAEHIDLTSLEYNDGFRHMEPKFHRSYVRASFYLTYDDFWRRFDPAAYGNWHHVEIANRPAGVIYSCKTVLTKMDQTVVVGDVVKLNLEFASIGPITTVATKRVKV